MRRRTLAGICHDEQFHKVVVHRVGRRLDNEDILSADTFTDHDLGFTVVEMTDIRIAEIDANAVCNLIRKLRIRVTGQNDQISGV